MTKIEEHRALRSAMSVRELREQLEGYDDDAPVLFVCDYGDYCHTQQALPVGEIVETDASYFADSGYSKSGLAFHEEEDEDDEDDEEDGEVAPVAAPSPVVILR